MTKKDAIDIIGDCRRIIHTPRIDGKRKRIAFLTIFEKCRAMIVISCRQAGIARSTFYDWLQYDDFKEAVEEIRELSNDIVESKLLERINSGDTTAIIFYAKTRMKGRGYVERNEVSLSAAPEDVSGLPTDALLKMHEIAQRARQGSDGGTDGQADTEKPAEAKKTAKKTTSKPKGKK